MVTLTIQHREVEEALEALADAGVETEAISIRPAYSGRGMVGATCAGVALARYDLTAFMVALTLAMVDNGRGDSALAIAQRTHIDQMGRGIVAYWPGVELIGI